MLLRRITQHVKDQNWFAVFVDFLIVVVGVFIGIQVANWNEQINNKKALNQNLERLQLEVQANITIIDSITTKITDGKKTKFDAISILQSCEDSSTNRATIVAAINLLSRDPVPTFLNASLKEITSQERSLNLLTPEFRKQLSYYQYGIKEQEEQITLNFNLMWINHIRNNNFIDANFNNLVDDAYYDIKLSKPINDICRDSNFRREFNNTMGFYEVIGLRLASLKKGITQFSQTLTEEQKVQQ